MSEPKEFKSYHFDCGNSSEGAIGFSARIEAESEEDAVKLLKERLADMLDGYEILNGNTETYEVGEPRVDYLNVYLNPAHVSAKDIDSVDEIFDDE